MEPIPELLHAWHDFFVTLATAAATLVGAMFVVMSIGSGFLTQDRTPQIRAFHTATLVHLAGVLLAVLLVLVPSLDRIGLGVVLAIGGVIGLGFSLAQLPVLRGNADALVLEDWFWYLGAPIAGYLAGLAAAACLLIPLPRALELLAFALVLLLLTGIRNAWDMIVFLVTRKKGE